MEEHEDLNCEEQIIRTHSDLRKEVFVRDDLLVFPPINHENLYIDGFDKDRESSSTPSSSSPSSSSSLSPFDSDGRETDGKSPPSDSGETNIIQRWWKLLLARVFSKFQNMVTCLCSFSETLRSFYPVIVVVSWWWMRNRARRRLHGGETEVNLRDTIKERDEVCYLLLHEVFDEMPKQLHTLFLTFVSLFSCCRE